MAAHFSFPNGLPALFNRLEDDEEFASLLAPEEMTSRHFPLVAVVEDEGTIFVRAVIPGATLSDVCLTFTGGKLVIRGVIPAPVGMPLRRERPTGPFRRDISMPCPVVVETITAVMRNGILTVSLPKERRREKRSIPIVCFQGLYHE